MGAPWVRSSWIRGQRAYQRAYLPSLIQSSLAMPATEVSVFLEEIAVSQTPKKLGALIRVKCMRSSPQLKFAASLSASLDPQVFETQGGRALAPTQREGLHPLLVPLCTLPSSHSSVSQACPACAQCHSFPTGPLTTSHRLFRMQMESRWPASCGGHNPHVMR